MIRKIFVLCFLSFCACGEEPERNAPPVANGSTKSVSTYQDTDYDDESSSSTGEEQEDVCIDFVKCVKDCKNLDYGIDTDTDNDGDPLELCLSSCPSTPLHEDQKVLSAWVDSCVYGGGHCGTALELCQFIDDKKE